MPTCCQHGEDQTGCVRVSITRTEIEGKAKVMLQRLKKKHPGGKVKFQGLQGNDGRKKNVFLRFLYTNPETFRCGEHAHRRALGFQREKIIIFYLQEKAW